MNSDNHPLVAVEVAVYNVEKELDRCIDSVLAQDYKQFELILVDDGSMDSSGKICDEYAALDPRVSVIHRANGGLSAARNSGMAAAQGDFVTFVDSDDWIDPRYLSCLVGQVLETGAAISACDLHVSYDATLPSCSVASTELLTGRAAFEAMMYQTGITNSASGKLFSRSALIGFQFPVGRYFEDLWSVYQPVRRVAFVSYSRTPLYCYVQRRGSIMNSPTFVNNVGDLIGAIDALETCIQNEDPLLLPSVRSRKFSCYSQALYALRNSNDSRVAGLWDWMRASRFALILDRRARLKNRLAALSSLAGRRVFLAIYGAMKAS